MNLHISKQFADMIKKLGEDEIMHIIRVWDNRRRWQREHYAKRIKPTRPPKRPRIADLDGEVKDE